MDASSQSVGGDSSVHLRYSGDATIISQATATPISKAENATQSSSPQSTSAFEARTTNQNSPSFSHLIHQTDRQGRPQVQAAPHTPTNYPAIPGIIKPHTRTYTPAELASVAIQLNHDAVAHGLSLTDPDPLPRVTEESTTDKQYTVRSNQGTVSNERKTETKSSSKNEAPRKKKSFFSNFICCGSDQYPETVAFPTDPEAHPAKVDPALENVISLQDFKSATPISGKDSPRDRQSIAIGSTIMSSSPTNRKEHPTLATVGDVAPIDAPNFSPPPKSAVGTPGSTDPVPTFQPTDASATPGQERAQKGAAARPQGLQNIDTPSYVLSPTSMRYRNKREMREKLYNEAPVRPWGSKHPVFVQAQIRAAATAHTRGLNSGMTHAEASRAAALAASEVAAANASGDPSVYLTPPKPVRKTQPRLLSPLGMASTPRRPRVIPNGGLNAYGQPNLRMNNVRRPSSSVGEGPLLGPILDMDRGKHCLVLDLDETLVHSSFNPVPNPDIILPIEINDVLQYIYILKRPGCDEFLAELGKIYEIVVFTASLSNYADPLLDILDTQNVIRARLYREACVYYEGMYVKDLSILGRDPSKTIILDNAPCSFLFQPENAICCGSFIDDPSDIELYDIMEFLKGIRRSADVRQGLFQWATRSYAGPSGIVLKDGEHIDTESEFSSSDASDFESEEVHPHKLFENTNESEESRPTMASDSAQTQCELDDSNITSGTRPELKLSVRQVTHDDLNSPVAGTEESTFTDRETAIRALDEHGKVGHDKDSMRNGTKELGSGKELGEEEDTLQGKVVQSTKLVESLPRTSSSPSKIPHTTHPASEYRDDESNTPTFSVFPTEIETPTARPELRLDDTTSDRASGPSDHESGVMESSHVHIKPRLDVLDSSVSSTVLDCDTSVPRELALLCNDSHMSHASNGSLASNNSPSHTLASREHVDPLAVVPDNCEPLKHQEVGLVKSNHIPVVPATQICDDNLEVFSAPFSSTSTANSEDSFASVGTPTGVTVEVDDPPNSAQAELEEILRIDDSSGAPNAEEHSASVTVQRKVEINACQDIEPSAVAAVPTLSSTAEHQGESLSLSRIAAATSLQQDNEITITSTSAEILEPSIPSPTPSAIESVVGTIQLLESPREHPSVNIISPKQPSSPIDSPPVLYEESNSETEGSHMKDKSNALNITSSPLSQTSSNHSTVALANYSPRKSPLRMNLHFSNGYSASPEPVTYSPSLLRAPRNLSGIYHPVTASPVHSVGFRSGQSSALSSPSRSPRLSQFPSPFRDSYRG